MAYISEKFVDAMTAADLTRAQQERVVEALSREPFIIAAVERQRMEAIWRPIGPSRTLITKLQSHGSATARVRVFSTLYRLCITLHRKATHHAVEPQTP